MDISSCKLKSKIVFFVLVALIMGLPVACAPGEQQTSDSQLLSNASTSSHDTFCVSKHVRDFIKLNSERREAYALLSAGRSLSISRKMIAYEHAALVTLPLIEYPALEYQNRGVPLLCLDVVPVSETPSHIEALRIPDKPFEFFDGGALALNLLKHRLTWNEISLEAELDSALRKLSNDLNYNCLLRHFVESTLRTVRLTPKYRALSKKRGLKDPSNILSAFINSQILFFASASELDKQAAALQSEGIPILCNDLPVIPVEVSNLLNE
ncbi:MAG: hypothetical protein RI953_1473 [Pseudomonadota bacterium]|jgi:hypothetical protein